MISSSFFGLKALPNFYKEEEDICDGGGIGSGSTPQKSQEEQHQRE